MRPLILLVFFNLLTGCQTTTNKELEGLWQLEDVNIDGFIKPVSPVFLKIHANHSFAVSRVSGDMIGFYRLEYGNLEMRSEENGWFNTSWSLIQYNEYIDLKGLDSGYRNTRLRFRKISKMPTFQEFEDNLLGKWQVYKIRRKGAVERLADTWFYLDSVGNYSIVGPEGMQEYGQALVDTRHRKIIFENQQMTWNAWFYGEELRLRNEKLNVQYSLRKMDHE